MSAVPPGVAARGEESAAAAPGGTPSSNGSARVIDLPVEFRVVNTNTSELPCPSDGAVYTLRGHLVGPRSALERPGSHAATVYLHGFNGGELIWRFDAVPGYDFAIEMARLGHVSLTVDRLGYVTSGHPLGFQSCLGSAADVAHQLVGQLRAGSYSVQGGGDAAAPGFSEVILAGHDVGGGAAEAEAYSYEDVDAMAVLGGWAHQGFSQLVMTEFLKSGADCGAGGQEAEEGGPGGYFHFIPSNDAVRDRAFPYAEPEVREAMIARRVPNPCGDLSSAGLAGNTQAGKLAEIEVPVLLLYGEDDLILTPEAWEEEPAHYSGSADVTRVVLARAGHFPMVERGARRFRATISEWLRERGLLSAGALTIRGCPAANSPLDGTAGDDALAGSAADENLVGRAGSDRLAGRGGADCIDGGRSRDRMRGGGGADRLDAADGGRDSVRCGPGRDRATADPGDRLRGCERVVLG